MNLIKQIYELNKFPENKEEGSLSFSFFMPKRLIEYNELIIKEHRLTIISSNICNKIFLFILIILFTKKEYKI